MTAVHLVVPDAYDDLERPSGGNVYDRKLCEALQQLGWPVGVHAVPGPWPSTGGSARPALAQVLAGLPDDAVVVVDGLVGSGLPDVLLPESGRLRLVSLVHMPLGSVEGPDVADARAREGAVLERCDAVIATSYWSRDWLLEHYPRLPRGVVVAEPGVDRADPVSGTVSGGNLLCVGAVTPVKGHDVLVEALAAVRDLDWACTCVGATTIDPGFARDVAARAERHDLGQRVRFRGPLTGGELDSAYATADLLVLPSRAETYGMVVTEALARALPVIASDVGGVAQALSGRSTDHADTSTRPSRGRGDPPGVLLMPDDPGALAHALRQWLVDPSWRAELRRRALTRRAELSSWSVTAARVAGVLDALNVEPTRS